MTNDQLFRALVNTQSAMKAELLKKIETVDKKLDKEVVGLKDEMKKGFKDINERLDMLGKQLNVLDEDAPTGEDFRNLEQRVTNLEIQNQNFVMA